MNLAYSTFEDKIRNTRAKRRHLYERLLLRRMTGWVIFHVYMAIMAMIGHILLLNIICRMIWK
jgi:hypothetical protein